MNRKFKKVIRIKRRKRNDSLNDGGVIALVVVGGGKGKGEGGGEGENIKGDREGRAISRVSRGIEMFSMESSVLNGPGRDCPLAIVSHFLGDGMPYARHLNFLWTGGPAPREL